MVFSSLLFLFGFLPTFILVYLLTPNRQKNLTILIASYIFYAWGAPRFVFVLFGSTIIDYLIAKYIDRFQDDTSRKRALLLLSIFSNIGLLAYFKYANFFVGELNRLLSYFGEPNINWVEVALPVGISFFTFQKLSYVFDVYRNTVAPARSFGVFALSVALFPQLIAGPIIRYHEIADQLVNRATTPEKILDGIFRFAIGLGKKVLIADPLGQIADRVFALDVATLPASYAWLGILAYSFQIYFDFSGYSDMALGLGKMMGFEFPENFNCPYISQSISEFWRRWHITLSNWMKEYLYIPLGGNRVSTGRTYFNLCTVFFLSGLWHGASWNFVIWGVYHGCFLIFDKIFWLKLSAKLPRLVNILLTFFVAIMGWVLFRAPDITHATQFYGALFGASATAPANSLPLFAELVSNRAASMFYVALFFSFIPAFVNIPASLSLQGLKELTVPRLLVRFGTLMLLLFLSAAALANSHFHPFIYFRF